MQVSFPQKSSFATLRANSIICPSLDSGVGNLTMLRAGVAVYQAQAARTVIMGGALMCNDNSIMDGGGIEVLGFDGAGHIDALGRIDAPVTSPAASHSIYVTAGEVVSIGEHALINQTAGSWLVVASDMFYAWFGAILGRLSLLGKVYIESIKIYLATGHINDYITDWTLDRRPLADATRVQVVTSTIDIGNGSTGFVTGTLTVNHEVLADSVYSLEVSCDVANVNLKIYGLEIKYHMV